MKKRQTLVIVIVSFLLIVACTCAPISSLSTTGTEQPSVEEDNFPLTPDPVNVSVTLDTEREVAYQEGGYSWTIETESAEGALFRLDLPGLTLLETGDEGDLFPNYDSAVTMTPVLTIDGLPFSQGFLAAVQLGPEGGSLVSEAYLTMEIPGEYDPSELIGFAAEGSGEDFHLFPASFYSYDGTTHASFNITHFSLYGVARVLESEIVSQAAHPPADPASQDDQDLAPLTRIEDLAPLLSNLQLQLLKSYTRLVKPGMTSLAGTRCEQVSNTAYQLNAWVSKVDLAGQTDYFQSQIQTDQRLVYDRLTECIHRDCTACLNPPDGVTPDRRQVGSMIVMIAFASDMASALGLDPAITNSLWYLDYECSQNAGLPGPLAGVADGGLGGGDAPSGPDLACPGP